MSTGRRPRSVLVEADGGSRGNPGPASYGALIKDAETGELLAERGERIGVATNNVAEYRGLIAGLALYHEYAEGAELEVRMDSKLVVEQMSGRWKVKHPSMVPLAVEARRLAPPGTRYTWIPRERNTHADRLANLALDGPMGVVVGRAPAVDRQGPPDTAEQAAGQPTEQAADPGSGDVQVGDRRPPWEQGPPTTLVLVRHGETPDTVRRLFSGRTGNDPALSETGRDQVRRTAQWLSPLAGSDPVLLASPMLRTRESAQILAASLGVEPDHDEGLVEAGFGSWEGLTYAEVMAAEEAALTAWLGDPTRPAGGTGDRMVDVAARMEQVRSRLLAFHPGRTLVLASHLTPIKMLVHQVLDMPLSAMFRTEIAPASVTVLAWYPDGRSVLRMLNGLPQGLQPPVYH